MSSEDVLSTQHTWTNHTIGPGGGRKPSIAPTPQARAVSIGKDTGWRDSGAQSQCFHLKPTGREGQRYNIRHVGGIPACQLMDLKNSIFFARLHPFHHCAAPPKEGAKEESEIRGSHFPGT